MRKSDEVEPPPVESSPAGSPVAAAAAQNRKRNPRAALIESSLLDVGVPLVLFYGLRLLGVNQWLALVLSGVIPVARLVYRIVKDRKLEVLTLFSLSMLVAGTGIALLTGDPRLLLARESYFTALIGLWMLGTLLARRPFIFEATVRLLPEETAQAWRNDWENAPEFRRVMRLLTVAWGAAFMIDSAARVVMAYTLPVDSVPLLGAAVLVVMLIIVVQLSKAYGRRLMNRT